MMGVNTRNMLSCLQKYNKLNKLNLVGQLLNTICDVLKFIHRGCVCESGDLATMFFSGSATLGRVSLSPFAASFKAF
jgi:hypothetical protein